MDLSFLLLSLVIILFSAILHEIAHGYVAERLGDPTARLMGRLTLNPLKHIDPIMSIVLPVSLALSGLPPFGGAKPVPVDPFNLRDGRKDMALVAIAGPLTNVGIALIAALLYKLFGPGAIADLFSLIATLNLLLAIFNLIPIPPLDGSKAFALFLPEREANQYLGFGNIGLILLYILLISPFGSFSLSRFIYSILSFGLSLLGLPVSL